MNRVRRFGAGLIGAAFLVVAAPVYADSGTFTITSTTANSASGNYSTPEGDAGTFTITRTAATGYAAPGAPGSATALFSASGSTGIQLLNSTDVGTLPTPDSFSVTLTLVPNPGSRPTIIEVSQQTTQATGNSETAAISFSYSGPGASQGVLAANPAVTLHATNGNTISGVVSEQVRQFGTGCPNPLVYGGSPGGVPQTGTNLASCPVYATGSAIPSGTIAQLIGVDNGISAYRVDLRNATTVTVGYTGNMRGNAGQPVSGQRNTGETFNEWLGFGVRSGARLNLAKAWVNGRAGDAVTVTTTGGTNNATLTSTVPTATNGAFAGVFQGDQVVLPAETFTVGSAANYNVTVACTGGSPLASGPVGRTLTISNSTADTTCTYTNSRIAQQVNLAKTWGAGATAGHTAGATTTGGTTNATFNSTAPATNTTGAAVTMYAGDVITLPAETFGGGATAANYTVALACTGGSPLASGAVGRQLTIAANTTATTCRYTNTAATAGVTLRKTWTNGKASDAVGLTITGGTVATPGSSVAGGASTNATATANVGATVTLAENFTTGAAGNYTTTLACVDANNAAVTVSGTGLSRTITMPATAVTCTYTNSRIAQQLNLAKSWGAGATSGHTAGATTTGGSNNATFSSTAPSTGLTGIAVTVYAGDAVTLPAETFGGGATAANYSAVVACTGGTTLASTTTLPQTVTIAASTTATTCTYTNSVATVGVTLKKTWTNGKANDAVDLTITGGSGAVAGSSTVGGTSTDATATANAGATVTLTEAFRAGTTGSNYTTTLACTDANNAAVTVSGTGLSRTITMPATAVTCTYTNSRIAQQLNLAKSWGAGATSGHTAGATTTGGSNNATFNSTAPSTGLTGTAVTVYAGDAVTLPAETFGGGATAANYSAAVACTGGTTLASTTTLPQTVTIAASTTATICTYTNTLNSADLAVVKTNDATSVVGGGTTTYSVTVSNRGASAVTGAVVSDTPVAGLSACQVTACTPGGACPAQPGDLLAVGGATLGTLAAGAQAMFTVTCNVNP
ncbi:beta strand repeat-containing protein [Lysobacter enzymogenes]|uniref:beta strand repeat-containing protein n=1 Tax=Lysobacter enzymogenes TaxID=69 RepID=UPI003850A524